jgi:hypothetical protein
LVNLKVNSNLEQATEAQRRRRGKAPLPFYFCVMIKIVQDVDVKLNP